MTGEETAEEARIAEIEKREWQAIGRNEWRVVDCPQCGEDALWLAERLRFAIDENDALKATIARVFNAVLGTDVNDD